MIWDSSGVTTRSPITVLITSSKVTMPTTIAYSLRITAKSVLVFWKCFRISASVSVSGTNCTGCTKDGSDNDIGLLS